MKLKEFLSVCSDHARVELHSAYDGRIVASTRKSLEKYGEIDVISAHPCIKINTDGSFATPYLYIYGSHYQINEVKKNV
jgi:hypothetical protein